MKKLAVLFMVGSLVVSGATTSLGTAKAADTKNAVETSKKGNKKNIDFKETNKNYFAYPGDTDFKETNKNFFAYPGDTDFKETDKNFFGYPDDMDFRELDKNFFAYPSDMDAFPSLEEFLKKDTKLTKAEKKSLTENYDKLEKTRKDIDKTSEEIEKITNKITDKWAIADKIDEAANKHQALWDKVYENATDEDLAIEDNIEFIKSSKALTDEEKETLIKAEEELRALNEEHSRQYNKVNEATKELTSKLDSLYKDVENLMDKMQPLANKLGEEFKENFGFVEIMPY
ncbi:MAG: hypothetical protein ACTTKP_01320 [Catonella sp.]|uniref:hypothetical protein n=1 Tax=Catonella sp. TaxID=2382125 RepID=UPI003FA088A7